MATIDLLYRAPRTLGVRTYLPGLGACAVELEPFAAMAIKVIHVV
jgi:hypothetical protein